MRDIVNYFGGEKLYTKEGVDRQLAYLGSPDWVDITQPRIKTDIVSKRVHDEGIDYKIHIDNILEFDNKSVYLSDDVLAELHLVPVERTSEYDLAKYRADTNYWESTAQVLAVEECFLKANVLNINVIYSPVNESAIYAGASVFGIAVEDDPGIGVNTIIIGMPAGFDKAYMRVICDVLLHNYPVKE